MSAVSETLVCVAVGAAVMSVGGFAMAARLTVVMVKETKRIVAEKADNVGLALRHVYNEVLNEDISEFTEFLDALVNGKEPW